MTPNYRTFLFEPTPETPTGGETPPAAPAPAPFTIEFNGEHLTPDQVQERLKTYAGKANEFDKASREKADLEKNWKEAQPKIEFVKKLEDYRERLVKVDQTGIPDDEAYEGFMRLVADKTVADARIAEYRALRANQSANPQAGSTVNPNVSGVDPAMLATMWRKVQEIDASLKANSTGSQGLSGDMAKVMEFVKARELETLTATAREHLTADPVLGRLVSDAEGAATILPDVVSQLQKLRASGVTVTPEVTRRVAEKHAKLVQLIDRVLPASGVVGPGSMGSTPTAPQTTSRLVQAKEPKIDDYNGQPNALDKFTEAYFNWQRQQPR